MIEIGRSDDRAAHEFFLISDREHKRSAGWESAEHRFQEADDRVVAPGLKALKPREANLPSSHLREPVGKRAIAASTEIARSYSCAAARPSGQGDRALRRRPRAPGRNPSVAKAAHPARAGESKRSSWWRPAAPSCSHATHPPDRAAPDGSWWTKARAQSNAARFVSCPLATGEDGDQRRLALRPAVRCMDPHP